MTITIVKQYDESVAEETGRSICAAIDEVIIVCPKCKTLETLWFSRGVLVPTRKFRQMGSQVYHDCGSTEPCCLYHF